MRTGSAPQVLESTIGLARYLRDLVRSHRKPVRDLNSWHKCLWLAAMPPGTVRVPTDPTGMVLTVEHVPYEPPPPAPEVLVGWLPREAKDDATGELPELAATGPLVVADPDRPGEQTTVTVKREENVDVLRAYTQWAAQRREWWATEQDRRPRRELHKTLTEITRQLTQQDDSTEAVLGVGLLRLPEREGEPVRRHLLTCRVSVTADRRTGRVTVRRLTDVPARLEDRDFLTSDDGYVSERADELHDHLAAGPIDLLSGEVAELLSHWNTYALDRAVAFNDTDIVPVDDEAATLTSSAALIVRNRDSDAWLRYFDRIIDTLAGLDSVAPLGLAQLVVQLEREERLSWGSRQDHDPTILGTDPLFPLEANEPQRQILHRLATDSAVVVEGPPGTGKTHTIANLVSALLAQGKRILVTSQKEKALRVLRDKLPVEIRGMCVLSTGDRSGTDELERSIAELSEQVATISWQTREQRINQYTRRRRELAERLDTLERGLVAVREAELIEYDEIDVARGYRGTLSHIVHAIQATTDRLDWLPPLPEGAPAQPAMTTREMLELRSLLASATSERRELTDRWLPQPTQLPTGESSANWLPPLELTMWADPARVWPKN